MDNTNIKLIRLQTGEDVIADMAMSDNEDIVTLNNPMHVIFKRTPTGRVIMMMMPWLPLEIIDQNSANIYTADILTVLEPKESLVEYYGDVVEASLDTMKEDTTIRDRTTEYDNGSLEIEELDFEDGEEEIPLYSDFQETKNKLH